MIYLSVFTDVKRFCLCEQSKNNVFVTADMK